MPKKEPTIKGILAREYVLAEDNKVSKELHEQSNFGELQDSQFHYSFVEALYLFEKKKMILYNNKKKKIKNRQFITKASTLDPHFSIKYMVYKDMRNRGYIVKTALKFGADFRVYDRGIKPGQDHAKWILYPIHESETLTWHDFSAKNRVAHSTRKRLLLAIVDDEGDVSYWETAWKRP